MNVKLDVRHLRLITAVAEEGTVTSASKRLHLTQSALSHQLRDAEEKLGAQLFLRINKRMVLTPAGEQLLAAARRVLQELKVVEEQVQQMNGGAAGVLRISTSCYTCYHWLPAALRKYRKKFPKVEVRIDAQATDAPLEAVLEGRLDIAIVSEDPLTDKRLAYRPLFEDELHVILPVGHRLAERETIRPRDLEGETMVIYPPREESTLLQLIHAAGVEAGDIIEIPLTEAIIQLVQAGMGIGFLSRWAVARWVESKTLVARPIQGKGQRRQWSAVSLRTERPSAHLKEFVDVLADVCFCQSGDMPRFMRSACARREVPDPRFC